VGWFFFVLEAHLKNIFFFLLIFATGIVIGAYAVIIDAYFNSDTVQSNLIDYNLIDYVISEWTQPKIESPFEAGFPSKVELPSAHPGYFPDTVIALAKLTDSLYHIPYEVTLCQFALESSWGQNNLSLSNYFGLTYEAVKQFLPDSSWAYRRDLVSVNGSIMKRMNVRFASFKNIAECFLIHGKYLSTSKRYARAFRTHSPEKFARSIAECGYAQDSEYALKLVVIMRRYKLH